MGEGGEQGGQKEKEEGEKCGGKAKRSSSETEQTLNI